MEIIINTGQRITKHKITGLGRNVAFAHLSEKRITTFVRKLLRGLYGLENVNVSCSATYKNGTWAGFCRIRDDSCQYEIR